MPYYVTIDNTKLYYEVRGEGKPLIFIHGWSCSTESFATIVEDLRNKYQCISYDHRGHGASSMPQGGFTITQLAKDLRELIEYLNLNDIVLVGHSMGAATIFSYISQFDCDRISKIVLLDMSPKLLNDENWNAGLLSGQYKMNDYMEDMEIIGQSLSEFMWKFWRMALPEFEALPETLKDLVAPGLVGVNNPHALACLWHSMLHLDYRDSIKKITVPALYFLPDHPLYSRETAEFIKNNSSSTVDIVAFENCTHMIMDDQSQKTIDEIDHFIKAYL
ncbi:alpha/beta fold hydrolase [Fusibacter ferrireducens]|uniref:Alpha/beta hydrolase n=1 Tax=Fusibacter ferrireducens TaxID=2785058 RepID=A0ABR9ZW56_9FIRM|nr:alpha/beta hydrolase [Fusibacter ferrireducens]MBF4694682.1 alpha/beta hydrolase [Fusibacter ferrireducens]